MTSAAVGRSARRKDSVLPAQSWNSSQTSTGFSVLAISAAILAPTLLGSARAEAMTPQKPMNSRRETPLRSSSLKNQLFESFIGDASSGAKSLESNTPPMSGPYRREAGRVRMMQAHQFAGLLESGPMPAPGGDAARFLRISSSSRANQESIPSPLRAEATRNRPDGFNAATCQRTAPRSKSTCGRRSDLVIKVTAAREKIAGYLNGLSSPSTTERSATLKSSPRS